jgi:hypothetical protein
MGHDLATRAELVKLARALGTTPERVAFAAALDHDDIRRVRQRVMDALYDEHRAAYRRVAAITRVLPTPTNVRITLRAFPPLLAARIAGEMEPDRAAALANRMPVEYLADCCVHLDPRRAGPLISRVDHDRVLAVVHELVGRGDFITLGRMLDAAAPAVIARVADTVSDEAVLRVGFYAESDAKLTGAVTVLPPTRLRDLVRCALNGPPDLRSAGLALISRITNDELRGTLADHAAAADNDVLTRLLRTAIDDGAVPELLSAVAAMSEPARRRVLTLPAIAEQKTFTELLRARSGRH